MATIGRLLSFALVTLAMISQASLVRADDADGGSNPVLRIPGLPPVPLPPGTHVFGPGQRDPAGDPSGDLQRPDADIYHEFGTVTPGGGVHALDGTRDFGGMVVGPGGVIRPEPKPIRRAAPKVLTPEEKQAQIRKALTPQPPLAVVRRKTLDDLYVRLAAAKDESEAKGVASLIVAVWNQSGSDTANLLMARAEQAALTRDYPLALSVLDKVVSLRPGWAEAWNKRATVRYLAGDLNGSMADVDHVLKIEPNHFAALNGLAMILQRTGFSKRALQVYRRELAIYPHQPEIEQIVEKLTSEVEGQGI